MRKVLGVIALFFFSCAFAQVKGKIKNGNGNAVPNVNIIAENTGVSALSNQNGDYILQIKDVHDYIIFSALGYKPVRKNIDKLPLTLNVTLEPQEVIQNLEKQEARQTVANDLMDKVIAHRKSNAEKTANYTADFYSLGEFSLTDVPKEILGQEIGDLGASLDSTRSGIIYLSETYSAIKYSAPGKLHERVLAGRVSGEDNGYSYNNAEAADFNFYNNFLPFEVSAISPLADNAKGYYNYELENIFYTPDNQLINKIKVIPKVENQPVMDGYIYIVNNTFELYAVALSITGNRIKQPLLNQLNITQTFSYNKVYNVWQKNIQTLNFDAGLLGVGFKGMFNYAYSNYNFNPQFTKNDFGGEVLLYEKDAGNKPESYWQNVRPVILTPAQREDYAKKARLEALSSTKTYTDSIDAARNKFKWFSPVLGYTYRNTYNNWDVTYTGIVKRLSFNTVQAYWVGPGFYFTKRDAGTNNYTTVGTDVNYGFAEQRFRATGFIERKFNSFTNRIIKVSGGSSIEQYNREEPINKVVNSVSTLFFRENYMKLYDNAFLKLQYEEEVVNGVKFNGSVAYKRRHALSNNTDYSTLHDIYKPYTSNNPLLPYDYDTPAFLKHNIYIAAVGARISFGQKYWTLPDRREIISNYKYPRLYLDFEKGFASSIKNYNFNHLSARVTYDISLNDKGELGTNFRAGKFFDSDNIAFTDYRHFNGNQTHVGKSERYLNVFNFLPYYTHSTNDQYFEAHLEQNFKGYLLNAIPLINKLNYYLVAGYHFLAVPEHNPYMEYTIGLDNVGWGKARFLRFDFIQSYDGSTTNSGVIFGLTFIDFLE